GLPQLHGIEHSTGGPAQVYQPGQAEAILGATLDRGVTEDAIVVDRQRIEIPAARHLAGGSPQEGQSVEEGTEHVHIDRREIPLHVVRAQAAPAVHQQGDLTGDSTVVTLKLETV